MVNNSLELLKIFFRDWQSRLLNRPAHVTLFITSACNYRCRFCFYWRTIEKKRKNLLTLPEYQKVVAKFPSFTTIALTGGEPFLREGLAEIARLFYEQCQVRSIFIPTNASLPEKIEKETEKIVKNCPAALVTICLSLDGVGRDHDFLRGKKGAYEKLLDTLTRLKGLRKKYGNIELNCSFAYTKDNQDKLLETYRVATDKLGIKNFNVSLVRGDAREKDSLKIDIEKYAAMTQKIDKESVEKHKLSKFGSLFEEIIFARTALVKKLVAQIYKRKTKPLECLAGRFNLVITEEGDVYPCEMLDKKLGSLRESGYDIKKILNSARARRIINWIKADNCSCTHEFNLPDNILYSPKGILMLLKYWVQLKFGRTNQRSDVRTVLAFNVFDENYAAYIRSRRIRDFFLKAGYQVIYSEANYQRKDDGVLSIAQFDNLLGYLWGTIQRAYYTLRLSYDVLFLHQLSPLTVPLLFLAKARGKKVIFDWDDLASGVQSSQLRSFICRLAEGDLFIRMADAITSHNQSLIRLAREKGQARVFMVPQGVDTQLFDASKYQEKKEVLKKKLGLIDKKVLIYTASFNTGGVWDLDVIFRAVKMIEEKKENVFFLVLGGGFLLPEYKKKAKALGIKNIKFTGRIPHEKVPEYLSLADMGLVFMRDNIGNRMKMSFKTLEYLSMPMKVVGHLVGETKKAVGQLCYLSGPSSLSLSRTILATLEGPKKARARNFIIAHYDWQVVKRHFGKLIKVEPF